MQNWEECVAGTEPLDPCSQFTLLVPERMDGTAYTVRWQSVSNHLDSVLRSTNLLHGFEVIIINIPATPPINSYTGFYATGSTRLFKVKVR